MTKTPYSRQLLLLPLFLVLVTVAKHVPVSHPQHLVATPVATQARN